jgi:hypothetical protein
LAATVHVSDRVVFEKLVKVLVFGCAYWRIADEGCSATTLRWRRDEWIEEGVMDHLPEMALEAYDRLIGLLLGDLAVDGWLHHQEGPLRRREGGRSPVDRREEGIKRRQLWTEAEFPLGPSVLRTTATTRRSCPRPWTS